MGPKMTSPPATNAFADTVPVTAITPVIASTRLAKGMLPVSAILPILRVVVPVAFPLIVSVSLAMLPGAKFTLSATAPPPAKLPEIVSASVVSLSLPASSVPPAETLSVSTDTLLVPNVMEDPAAMPIVSHPVRFALLTDPDMFLSVSAFADPPPPSSRVELPRVAPSRVRFPESSASLMLPLTVAPLSTTTLSQPFRPSDTTVACRPPEPPLNVSVSPLPSPPSISVTAENAPPANVSESDPAPSLTLPAIAAPAFTVTAVSPAEPRIALASPPPTDAPLPSRTVTSLPDGTSVLIAAAFVPLPPVTALDTAMLVAPLPS